MTDRIHLVVPGEPVPMPRARVVTLKNGKSHAYTPEEAVHAMARVRRAAELVGVPLFEGPVVLVVHAFLGPERVTYWKRGSGDADNYAKLAQDALEGLAFKNDAAVVHLSSWKHPSDEQGPRLEIYIHPVDVVVGPGRPKRMRIVPDAPAPAPARDWKSLARPASYPKRKT